MNQPESAEQPKTVKLWNHVHKAIDWINGDTAKIQRSMLERGRGPNTRLELLSLELWLGEALRRLVQLQIELETEIHAKEQR